MIQHINAAGLALIKNSENCKLAAYLCPADIPTIGWGHTGPDVHLGMTITLEQAGDLLARDLQRFEGGVASLMRNPSSNELSACVSLAFNIGLSNFAHSSVLRLHNDGDKIGAAHAFGLWNKAKVKGKLVVLPGLVKRRAAEAVLYSTRDAA